MKIHHLNRGSVRQIDPSYEGPPSAPAVNHCLLVETDTGLVLVETGLGLDNIRHPAATLGADWVQMAEPALREDETAIRQIERKGLAPTTSGTSSSPRPRSTSWLPNCAPPPRKRRVSATARHIGRTVHSGARTSPLATTGSASPPSNRPARGDQARADERPHSGPHGRGDARRIAVAPALRRRAYYYHRELDEDPEPHPVLDVVQTRSEVGHDKRVSTQPGSGSSRATTPGRDALQRTRPAGIRQTGNVTRQRTN